jgi:hypothetical protein
VVKLMWRREWMREMNATRTSLTVAPNIPATLSPELASSVSEEARDRLIASAEQLMEGRWKTFAVERDDVGADPDWFTDPRRGERAVVAVLLRDRPSRGRDGRQHQVRLGALAPPPPHRLAAAYFLTGDERYAERTREHLTSWWHRNPFLSGVHWTSGIEVGVGSSPGSGSVASSMPGRQRRICSIAIRYFSASCTTISAISRRSRVTISSANNHVIAEAAGLFAAACAFPWFPESEDGASGRRRSSPRGSDARRSLGLNRELATDYHAFVFELCVAAALEGEARATRSAADVWDWLRRMADAAAAIVDERLRRPGKATATRGRRSCSTTRATIDGEPWSRRETRCSAGRPGGRVPHCGRADDTLDGARADVHQSPRRARARARGRRCSPMPEWRILRDLDVRTRRYDLGACPEIWCRCDHGPLGFLSVAAHGHADALALEVRCGGVDVLADPGTYCYHGEREWRTYFRSTLAHNTLELGGVSQSVDGGPFLWLRTTPTQMLRVDGLDSGPKAVWEAEHGGYRRLSLPPCTADASSWTARRGLSPSRTSWTAMPPRPAGSRSHLGPAVTVTLSQGVASLRWRFPDGAEGSAELRLPDALDWSAIHGRADPVLGWYSPAFDERCEHDDTRRVRILRARA